MICPQCKVHLLVKETIPYGKDAVYRSMECPECRMTFITKEEFADDYDEFKKAKYERWCKYAK